VPLDARRRAHRPIAARIEQIPDGPFPKNRESPIEILFANFIARRSQRRGGRARDRGQRFRIDREKVH
jgi:hypothetical protein